MGLKPGQLRSGLRNISTGRSAIPDSGISRWTFDDADTESGTALDVRGDYDGTINGATSGVSGANQTYSTGEAYSFDGTDDYVSFPNIGIFDGSQSFSLAAWFRREADVDQMIISLEGEYAWRLKYDNGNDAVDFNVYDGSATKIYSSSSIADSTWYHTVAVYDANDGMELYVDGSSDGSNDYTTSPASGSGANAIGIQGNDLSSKPFSGPIDDVQIYDKALTATEVSDLYNTGSI